MTLLYAPFAEPQKSDAFPYKLRWKYLVPNPLQSAVSEGDSLYFVASTEGRLSALRKSDGVRVWRRRDLGPVWAPPVVWGEQVIVADAWGLVRSLRADTGDENWSFQRTGGGRCVFVQAGNLLYVSAADGWLYALGSDGREQWRVRTGKGGALGVAVRAGMVYTSSSSGWLSLDSASGRRIFERNLGALVTTSPSVIDGQLIVATGDGYVRSHVLDDGESSWRAWLGARLVSPPVGLGEMVGARGEKALPLEKPVSVPGPRPLA